MGRTRALARARPAPHARSAEPIQSVEHEIRDLPAEADEIVAEVGVQRWVAVGNVRPGTFDQNAVCKTGPGRGVIKTPGLPKRPPSSREIARRREKAEAEARTAEAAQMLVRQVQPGLRPPAGRLFANDAAGLVLRGPADGIGSSSRIIATLEPLTHGGRHPVATLVTVGGWKDKITLREALNALATKLAVLGLRVCRRKAGLRMTKARPS